MEVKCPFFRLVYSMYRSECLESPRRPNLESDRMTKCRKNRYVKSRKGI